MRKAFRTILVLAVMPLLSVSCAKSASEAKNESAKKYLDAWMQMNYPGINSCANGIYILEDTPGTGRVIKDSSYVFLEYQYLSLEGTIQSYTDAETAKKLGDYAPSVYYGPEVLELVKGSVSQGLIDAILGGKNCPAMKVGGSRKVLIPGWLTSTSDFYNSEKEYIDNVTGSNFILNFKVVDACDNIITYQIQNIKEYLANVRKASVDSTGYGFYYKKLASKGIKYDTLKFSSDTSIYINYTGRLLNGQVFDTTIKDTAKVWNIYTDGKDYAPVKINWASEKEKITMGEDGSSVITGFARTLWQMHPYEKGFGVFTSYYGYGTSGSGLSIPGFAPLEFEIEIVDDPNK